MKKEAKQKKNDKNNNPKKFDSKRVGMLALDIMLCTLGTLMYSASVVCFIQPMQFVPGGLTTLAIMVNHFLPFLPVGMLVFLLNVPLFIASWKAFGFRFIAKTLGCSVMLSVFIDVLTPLAEKYPFLLYAGDEKLLAAIFGGIIMGVGLGIVFLRGATTGGTDIIGRLLRLKFPHVSVGKLVMVSDLVVISLAGLMYKSFETVLFSLVIIFLNSLAVDFVVSGRNNSKMMLIMTSKPEEVMRDIMTVIDRGVSVLDAVGGYTGEARKMLMCVVRAHEVSQVRHIIAKYDEKPFIVITDSKEVLGEGFKSYNDTL
jgi:uncharacterized membrane-anchored protein YitT (DUF2179 family)